MNTHDAGNDDIRPEESESGLMAVRKMKCASLRAAGVDPYPYAFTHTHTVEDMTPSRFTHLYETDTKVAVPGRVMAVRSHGNLVFLDIGVVRGQEKLQLAAVRSDLDASSQAVLQEIDIGDWVGAIGSLMYTRTRQETVRLTQLVMLAKAIRPFPNFKGAGVADQELLAKMPELAMIFGDKRRVLRQRAAILRTLRDVLVRRGLTEVETPYLNPHFGGAEARPFTTHVRALDMDVFLAVSPEIELKRLIVGGLTEGVFAIARNFRNEGIDHSHNPEFTSMEAYIPYVDYEAMMGLVEEIFVACCIALRGTPYCQYQGTRVDFTAPWPRIPVVEAVERATGIAVSRLDIDALRIACRERGLDRGCYPEDMSRNELVQKVSDAGALCLQEAEREMDNDALRGLIVRHRLHMPMDLDREWDFIVLGLFEAFVEPTLIQPCHIILHPARSTVLCKKYRGGPLPNGCELVERFESYVIGMEISNAYSELNDPYIQRELIQEQAAARSAGNEEAMPHNELFIRSLEYGMPPCGGLGIGIDRLVMLLTDTHSIREVVAFPLARV